MSGRRRNMQNFSTGAAPLLDRVPPLIAPPPAFVEVERVEETERRPTRRPSGPYVVAMIGNDRRRVEVRGSRVIETLRKIVECGHQGITAQNFNRGARLADNIFKLKRRYQIPIHTDPVQHDGGTYGRYRLTEPVELIEPTAAAVAA